MLNKKLIIIKEIINKKMDKLKVNEIKEIYRFMGLRGYSTLKKPQLLERMRNESIYDAYLNKKKKENQDKEKSNKLKDEKMFNLQDFKETIELKDLYNEDESDTEDSVCEDEFEDFRNEYLVYGDYPEIEDELNTKNTAQEQKEYFLPKLAQGSIPCFALTSADAGSDAAGSMVDTGTVYEKSDGSIGIRINCEKRYITLSPIADIVGIAFKIVDVDGIIKSKYGLDVNGEITLALVEKEREKNTLETSRTSIRK